MWVIESHVDCCSLFTRNNQKEIEIIVSKFPGKFTSLKSLKSHEEVVESHGISKAQNMNCVNYFGGQHFKWRETFVC